MFVLMPGARSRRLPLAEVLRLRHEEQRSIRDAEIARRTASGAPLVDEASKAALTAVPPFVPPDEVDGVEVVLQSIPIGEVDRAVALVTDEVMGDGGSYALASERGERAAVHMLELITRVVVELHGLETASGLVPPDLPDRWAPVVEQGGLTVHLFNAAVYAQRLTRGKGVRSLWSLPPTSES